MHIKITRLARGAIDGDGVSPVAAETEAWQSERKAKYPNPQPAVCNNCRREVISALNPRNEIRWSSAGPGTRSPKPFGDAGLVRSLPRRVAGRSAEPTPRLVQFRPPRASDVKSPKTSSRYVGGPRSIRFRAIARPACRLVRRRSHC